MFCGKEKSLGPAGIGVSEGAIAVESLYRLCYPGPHTKFSGMFRSERRLAEGKENKISIHRERVVCQHMDAIRLAQTSFQGFSFVNMIIDFVSDW
jgi:hypothetical protein